MFPEGRALEFLIVAVVALIVVGPKDLPVLLRKLGQFIAKLRGMANEFRASFDEMARQSELDELRKEVEAMRAGQQAGISAIQAPMSALGDDISRSLAEPVTTASQTAATEAFDVPAPAELIKPPRKPRARKKPAGPAA